MENNTDRIREITWGFTRAAYPELRLLRSFLRAVPQGDCPVVKACLQEIQHAIRASVQNTESAIRINNLKLLPHSLEGYIGELEAGPLQENLKTGKVDASLNPLPALHGLKDKVETSIRENPDIFGPVSP